MLKKFSHTLGGYDEISIFPAPFIAVLDGISKRRESSHFLPFSLCELSYPTSHKVLPKIPGLPGINYQVVWEIPTSKVEMPQNLACISIYSLYPAYRLVGFVLSRKEHAGEKRPG